MLLQCPRSYRLQDHQRLGDQGFADQGFAGPAVLIKTWVFRVSLFFLSCICSRRDNFISLQQKLHRSFFPCRAKIRGKPAFVNYLVGQNLGLHATFFLHTMELSCTAAFIGFLAGSCCFREPLSCFDMKRTRGALVA